MTETETLDRPAESAPAKGPPAFVDLTGQPVLVRTDRAGVHVGVLVRRSGQDVQLANARRIWYWKGAFTLSAVAKDGIKTGSRVSTETPVIDLCDAIEVMPTTEAARASFEKYGE